MKCEKLVSLVLAAVMMISLIPAAFAQEANKVFYFDDYDNTERELHTGATYSAKTNSITREMGKKKNGYVDITSFGSDDCQFSAAVDGGELEKLVVEIDITTKSNFSGGRFQCRDSAKKEGNFFTMKGNTITFGTKTKEIEPLKWVELGFLVDYSDLSVKAYVDGKLYDEYNLREMGKDITNIRLYCSKGTGNILIDNFAVYEGDDFRDVSGEYVVPEPEATPTPKPVVTNTDTITENVGKALHYANFDESDFEFTLYDVANKGSDNANSVTREMAGDNGYVKIDYLSGEADCFYQAAPGSFGINKLVFEIDISTETSMPEGNLQYKDSAKKQGKLFTFADNTITIGSNKVDVKAGKWVKLGFLMDFSTFKARVFADGKEIGGIALSETLNDMGAFRVYVGKSASNVGKNILIDNVSIYGGEEFRDISREFVPPEPAPVAVVGEDVELPLTDTSKIGSGVALKINKSNAYANGSLTKVDINNEAVVPVIVNSRTLVPVRFISENFGAEVAWDEAERKVSVKTADKTIELTIGSNIMKINGAEQEIDVPAEIMESRTMLPLRALVEAIGKNVLWDERGLIVITEPDITLDATADVKVATQLINIIETGSAKNYAAYPSYTQSVIDEAVKATKAYWTAGKGNSDFASYAANAIYYLTTVVRADPDAAASDGTLVRDAVLAKFKNFIAGGNEPFASIGCHWGHAVFTSCLLLIKNTPVIYDALTDVEKERMDWIMRAMAIQTNWGYNDLNDYQTGFNLLGNFRKTWNPNYRCAGLSPIINASMYFGAGEVDKILTSFDFDTYIAKFKELGLTNIAEVWSVAGAELMENGGECTLIGVSGLSGQKAGDTGGSGVGVKVAFKYNEMGPDDIFGLFENLIKYTYSFEVISEWNQKGTDAYACIEGEKKSPFEGQMGMMREFASGTRSSAGYCFDSFMIINTVYANMKLFGGWDSSSEQMRKMDSRIYVGHEDLIYKMTEGYTGYSSYANTTKKSTVYEYTSEEVGYRFVKDMWRNWHCMLNEDIETVKNPEKTESVQMPQAAPKDGITEPPEGAFSAYAANVSAQFTKKSYYDLGKAYDKAEMEFDMVIGNDILYNLYDTVVMISNKANADKGETWSNANMAIQLRLGNINIRNGGAYVDTGLKFDSNNRYHVKLSFDAAAKTYSVEITPTYPTAGETFKAENFAFRTKATEAASFDSVVLAMGSERSELWIENFKIK